MKKLFIFLALTHQGFCNDGYSNILPPDHSTGIAPYSSLDNMSPNENEYYSNIFQNSYCKSFNSDITSLESDPFFHQVIILDSPEPLKNPALTSTEVRENDSLPYYALSFGKPFYPTYLIDAMVHHSYVWETRSLNSLDLTDQDLNEWLKISGQETSPPSPTPTPVVQPTILPKVTTFPVVTPPVNSTRLAPSQKDTIHNLTKVPITMDEYQKLIEVRRFFRTRYLDNTGALLCNANNAYLGVHYYIDCQPWPAPLKYRILVLLGGFGTEKEIKVYSQIFITTK